MHAVLRFVPPVGEAEAERLLDRFAGCFFHESNRRLEYRFLDGGTAYAGWYGVVRRQLPAELWTHGPVEVSSGPLPEVMERLARERGK